MADHYLKSIESLDELTEINGELRELYSQPKLPSSSPGLPRQRQAHVQRRIEELNRAKGIVLKKAEIHALLSLRQAIQDAVLVRHGAGS